MLAARTEQATHAPAKVCLGCLLSLCSFSFTSAEVQMKGCRQILHCAAPNWRVSDSQQRLAKEAGAAARLQRQRGLVLLQLASLASARGSCLVAGARHGRLLCPRSSLSARRGGTCAQHTRLSISASHCACWRVCERGTSGGASFASCGSGGTSGAAWSSEGQTLGNSRLAFAALSVSHQ